MLSAPPQHFDALDLVVVEAMLLAALGPDHDTLRVGHGAGQTTITLTPAGAAAVAEVATTPDPELSETWALLLTPGLVEAVVDRVGEVWRAEAEVGVDLALVLRGDGAAGLAALAAAGPVRVVTTQEAADIIAADVPSPDMVHLL